MNQKNISKLFLLLCCINISAAPDPTPNTPMLDLSNLSKILPKNDELEKAEFKYYNQNTFGYKVLEIFIKAIASVLVKATIEPIIDDKKDDIGLKLEIFKILTETYLLLKTTKPNIKLYLTSQQEEIVKSLETSIMNYVKTGKKMDIESIFVCAGTSGTGKSATLFLIMMKLISLELKLRPRNNFYKFLLNTKIIPRWIKALLGMNYTKKGYFITLSGAYFYNYGNDKEKAAAHFEKMLYFFKKKIENNPGSYYILNIEEAELLTQEPFARILKVFTTEISIINKDEKHGLGLIFMSTNHIEQMQETLARRIMFLSFESPNIKIKINTLIHYLKKEMDINNNPQYTNVIIDYINEWIKFFENFSHSDIENCIWHLKLINKTKNNIVSILEFLIIINEEWLKREKIVNKNMNGKLQELEILIKTLQAKNNIFYNLLINQPDFDSIEEKNSKDDNMSESTDASEMQEMIESIDAF